MSNDKRYPCGGPMPPEPCDEHRRARAADHEHRRDHEREHDHDADRRRFLVGAAVVGAAAGGLVGCGKKDGGTKKAHDPGTGGGMPAEPTARKRPAPPRERPRARPKTFQGRSKVVEVVHSKAYDKKGQLVEPTVQQMVHTAVMELTGKKTPKEAWSSLFSPKEKVGLKPNMLGRQVCWTNPETVAAIVAGLKLAGVKEENMYMWDLKAFDISPLFKRFSKTKVNVKTTRDWGFGPTAYKIEHGPPTKLVKPLLEVDAVVNIPLIKDHRLAGVTCALKSVLGSIDNPRDHHTNPSKHKTCDPMVAELSALPQVKSKMRLILADAFRIIIEGGPWGNMPGRRTHNAVFAATDPVAMDRTAWTLIDSYRVKSKMVPLDKRPVGAQGPMGRPLHVLTAEKLGLGTADPKRIDHVVKKLG